MNILVIGDAMWDEYVFVERNRRSPEDPRIHVADIVSQEQQPGGCLNVAANIASLAKSEVCVSSIMSHATWRRLYEYKLRPFPQLCSFVNPDFELTKTRIVDFNSRQQIIRIDNNRHVSSVSVERLEKSYELNYTHMKRFDAVVVSDYGKGTITKRIIDHLETLSCPVFVDTKNPDLTAWNALYEGIVKINSKEWHQVTKVPENPHFVLIVTYGADGAVWRQARKFYPAEAVEDANVIGAGDSFLAGLAVEYVRTKGNIDKAIEFANLAGAASVKRFGTHIVKPWEVGELHDQQIRPEQQV